MALLFMDGFGAYGVVTNYTEGADSKLGFFYNFIGGQVDTVALTSTSEGVRNYLYSDDYDADLRSKKFTASTTIYVGFRFWYDGGAGRIMHFYGSDRDFMGHLNINSDRRMDYSINPNGYFSTYYGANTVSTKQVPAYCWNYLEAKIYFDNSAGTVDFWLNDVAVGSHTGLDTMANTTSGADEISFLPPGLVGRWDTSARLTDFYMDTTTRHGPCQVLYQNADTAGSTSGFTPSAGNNEDNVDEYGHDTDTTYNSSSATTTKDQIAHSDSLSTAPTAIQPMVMTKAEDSGYAAIKVGVLSGATEDLDSVEPVGGGSYQGVPGKIYEIDPNTSSAWTSTNANNAETVYEHN